MDQPSNGKQVDSKPEINRSQTLHTKEIAQRTVFLNSTYGVVIIVRVSSKVCLTFLWWGGTKVFLECMATWV